MLKTCSTCKQEKPHTEYYPDNRLKSGLQARCKSCQKESRDLKQKAEYDRKYHKERNKRPEIREQRIDYMRKWREDNPTYNKEYLQDNLEKHAANQAKRRAVKNNATVSWANKESVEAMYAMAQWLTNTTWTQYHVDHIVPLKHDLVCGLHCEDNLQVITAEENLKKSNTFVVE